MYKTAVFQVWKTAFHFRQMTSKKCDLTKLAYGDKPGTQTIIDIVVVVGNLVGKICELRLQRRLLTVQKTFSYFPQFFGIFVGTMLQDSFTSFKAKIQAIKTSITMFQKINHAK